VHADARPPLRDIAVVGASAGGVEALRALAAAFPADHAGAVLVVLHVMSGSNSVLGDILDRAGPLSAAPAADGEPLRHGRIYVAPPDHHLLVRGEAIALTSGPPESGHRPAVDRLFRSAAEEHGARVAGVVLSGAGHDGSAGLRAIADAGGMTLVQDPADALYDSMPCAALRAARVDRVATPQQLAILLCEAAIAHG